MALRVSLALRVSRSAPPPPNPTPSQPTVTCNAGTDHEICCPDGATCWNKDGNPDNGNEACCPEGGLAWLQQERLEDKTRQLWSVHLCVLPACKS